MKQLSKKSRFIIVMILFILIIILLIFGIIFGIKNKDGKVIDNTFDVKYTIKPNQIDSLKEPKVDGTVSDTSLPTTNGLINDISYNDLKQLFTSNKHSIVLVVNDSQDSLDMEAYLNMALKDYSIAVYKINTTQIKEDLSKYLNIDEVPAIHIINNGNATHNIKGRVDKETLKAFIDYFYIRNN